MVAAAVSLLAPLGGGAVSRLPAAMPSGDSARSFPLQAILRASDAQADDYFGQAVAIEGTLAVVGAHGEDGGPDDLLPYAGAAYVFERDETGASRWGQVRKLTASDAQQGDRFGISVAISGDFAIVGATDEDGPEDSIPGAGAVYVFYRHQGGPSNWGQTQKLTAPNAGTGDEFGYSVAIDGNTAVVGAPYEDGGPGDPNSGAGAAYVFQNSGGGSWIHVKTLRPSDAHWEDWFGTSVAISGDVTIVGAYGEDGGAGDLIHDAGAAYVFKRDEDGASQWGELEKLVASGAGENDYFGSSVAISGTRAVIGAHGEDGGRNDPVFDAGAAYLFEDVSGSGWTQIRMLKATDAQAGASLGISVAISGEVVLVSTPFAHVGPGTALPAAGVAYVYLRNLGGTDSWGQAKRLIAPDAAPGDYFGASVAVSGRHVVVGAYTENGGLGDPLTDAGAAYVFYVSLLEAFKAN